MRCELAVTVSGNHRLQYAMTKLLACARGAGSYFCRVRFVLLSRAHGLSRGAGLKKGCTRSQAMWSDMLFWWAVVAWRSGDLRAICFFG